MKLRDVILCGLQDLKAQRRKNRISFILIFLSAIASVGVNSTMEAIDSATFSDTEGHFHRILYNYPMDNWEEESQYFFDKYEDDERIEEIVVGPMNMPWCYWKDTMDILGIHEMQSRISTFYNALLRADYKGEKREPEYGEIILPRYIYDEGIYDAYSCYNSDELIGKTIKINMEPYELWEYSYEFKVIGTYDNMENFTIFQFYVGGEQAREMWWQLFDCRTEYYASIDALDDQKKSHLTNLIVKEGYDIDEVYDDINNEIKEDVGVHLFFLKNVERSPEIESYNMYIRYVGNIISYMLLLVAVINIVISAVSEVKKRSWEFALKMSMGYSKSDIVKIFAVEKVANVIKALIVALITLQIYDWVITTYYRNVMEYWKRSFNMVIEPFDVFVTMVLVVIAALMGVVTARYFINNIKISKVLNSGE